MALPLAAMALCKPQCDPGSPLAPSVRARKDCCRSSGTGVLISVILSTCNWPEALDASLRGLHRQTDHAFEVIVADDGSGSATATVVEAWRARLAITHVWHEDRGFRLAEIRNRAIRASRGDYC